MTEQELQQNYPAYSKSIFSDFMPDNTEVVGWQQNVLQKVKGDSILPHYIEKGRDFDTFWGWITHFFAIIVYFGRNFKKFFTDYTSYLDEVGEFMRERDYIQDSRVQINKDLRVILAEESYYNIFVNKTLDNQGEVVDSSEYYCSGYIPISQENRWIVKVGGYNESVDTYNGSTFTIKYCYYSASKTKIQGTRTISVTAAEAKRGKILFSITSSPAVAFVRISYPRLGNSSLPLYVKVFVEGEGSLVEEIRTEEQIFDIFSDFRKRGTFKGQALIKKVLESKEEDGFYDDYIKQKNTGWFLNRTSPIFGRLKDRIQIDAFNIRSLSGNIGTTGYAYGRIATLKDQYVILNQNTSIIVRWRSGVTNLTDAIVRFNIDIYDKDKNLISSDVPILGNWIYDSDNKIVIPDAYSEDSDSESSSAGFDTTNVDIKGRKIKEIDNYTYEAELPINILTTPNRCVFSTNTFDKDNLINNLKNLYIFNKFSNDGTKEAYYIKVNSIAIYSNISSNIIASNTIANVDMMLCLRKLPKNFGFLNNKQYYLCCFKNNGSYSNSEAAEIISQKVIPYNGHRIFMDNSFYKDDIFIPFDLKSADFDKILSKIDIEVIGGVPPYTYKYNEELNPLITCSQLYEKYLERLPFYENGEWVERRDYGYHSVKITDSLGESLLVKISCQPFNAIDYKFKLYVAKDGTFRLLINLFGGTETSYTICKYTYRYPYLYDSEDYQLLDSEDYELLVPDITESTGIHKVVAPPNVWTDITSVLGTYTPYNLSQITSNMSLYIRDNGIDDQPTWLIHGYYDLEFNLQELLQDFAVDIYDNGVGELVN